LKLKAWGIRGSIPVSGSHYKHFGGETTCFELRSSQDDLLIFDAGSGIRLLGNILVHQIPKTIHIFLSHFHLDHIIGLPFFKPIHLEKSEICFYGKAATPEALAAVLNGPISPPYFPISFRDFASQRTFVPLNGKVLQIGSLRVTPIPLSHPGSGFGYKVEESGKTVVVLSDNELGFQHPEGLAFEDYVRFCQGADLLYHDAEYSELEYRTKRSWGHSSFLDVLKLANQAGVRQLGLIHHNQDRTDEEIRDIEDKCQHGLGRDNQGAVRCFAVTQGQTVIV